MEAGGHHNAGAAIMTALGLLLLFFLLNLISGFTPEDCGDF
ncbi:hypothetical protein [Methanofollis sp. W23]|nr:hypothetical protein [Methanofollis sp. W23]